MRLSKCNSLEKNIKYRMVILKNEYNYISTRLISQPNWCDWTVYRAHLFVLQEWNPILPFKFSWTNSKYTDNLEMLHLSTQIPSNAPCLKQGKGSLFNDPMLRCPQVLILFVLGDL